MLPVRGLTIRIKFERDAVPTSAWWYGEQNGSERSSSHPLTAHAVRRGGWGSRQDVRAALPAARELRYRVQMELTATRAEKRKSETAEAVSLIGATMASVAAVIPTAFDHHCWFLPILVRHGAIPVEAVSVLQNHVPWARFVSGTTWHVADLRGSDRLNTVCGREA